MEMSPARKKGGTPLGDLVLHAKSLPLPHTANLGFPTVPMIDGKLMFHVPML